MSESTEGNPLAIERVVWLRSGAPSPLEATAAELDGARLLVMMHGLGASEHDLAPIAPLLQPGHIVAALGAPIPWGNWGGWAWFPLGAPGDPDPAVTLPAVSGVLAWLDTLPATPATIDLLGFSQGGAMSTQLLRIAPERFRSATVLSGFSLGGDQPGDATLRAQRPPVFWGWDAADPVIPPAAFARTGAWLKEHATLTERRYPGIGHGISREEIEDVDAFLAALPD